MRTLLFSGVECDLTAMSGDELQISEIPLAYGGLVPLGEEVWVGASAVLLARAHFPMEFSAATEMALHLEVLQPMVAPQTVLRTEYGADFRQADSSLMPLGLTS